jgi:outer membrane protein
MKRFILAAATCAALQLGAAEPKNEQRVGIVNFNSCIIESKLGKQEQNAFETMRKQLVTLIEDTDKQMREINEKKQDKDYLDGLSKEAIEAMDSKFSQLAEEMNRYQQQYYQFMHQGQNKIMQAVAGGIQSAAEQIASAKGYNMILQKEACFFYAPSLDITSEIVKEMDKNFDVEEKKQADAIANKTDK